MEKAEEWAPDGIQARSGNSKQESPQRPISREEWTKTPGETAVRRT